MKEKKKTILRLACFALALVSGLNLLSCIAAWLIADVLGGISFNVTKATTIGIIGGADGPTSVFITAAPVSVWELLLWSGLLAVSIWGLFRLKKQK